MTAVLQFLQEAANILPGLISIGEAGWTAAGQLIAKMKAVHDAGTVTDQDWDDLHALQDANTAIINAPMEGE